MKYWLRLRKEKTISFSFNSHHYLLLKINDFRTTQILPLIISFKIFKDDNLIFLILVFLILFSGPYLFQNNFISKCTVLVSTQRKNYSRQTKNFCSKKSKINWVDQLLMKAKDLSYSDSFRPFCTSLRLGLWPCLTKKNSRVLRVKLINALQGS